ncbi:MAG TPA: GAF domain-containing protein [Methylomirabilota bacterium]
MAPDTLDLDLVVRRLAGDAKARVSADAVAIWLLGLDGSELALRAALGFAHASTVRTLAHRPFGRLGDWLTARRVPSLGVVPASLPPARAWLREESIRSVLVVPLGAGGIRLGLLAAFRRRRPFTARQLAAARELAAAGGPAIHAALRFAEEREHVERAELLLAVTQTLASTSDLRAALGEIAHRTAAALGAECCEIRVADAPAPPPSPVPEGGAELVVPVGREYAAIGSLRLVRREGGEWAPTIVELATAIAGQIALAAENARLVRQAEAHAGELAALHDVTATLTSTLELPTVLETVADSARSLIGAQRCGVFELDGSQQLVPRASRGVPIEHLLTLRPGQGAVGAAALRRAPFFTPDWREHEPPGYATDRVGDDLLRDAVRRQGIRAVLAVPLVSKDTLVGVIAAAWDDVHAYDEREVRLLTGLAQQAAVALDRARVHTAALRRADELGALLRAARTVMVGLDRDATLQQIAHEAAGIAGTPHVKVLVLDTETRTLRVGAITGSPVPGDFALPLGSAYSGRVAVTGEPLFVADTANDPQNVLAQRDREAGIVTYLGLPVRSRERVVGVLTFNTTTPRRYAPAEVDYLASFADLAGIALDNARLYDEAQQALADLKAMQQKLVRGETLRALGELAGGAAHHLNNLLTIVVGRVQLLLRNVEDERLRRPLAIIEKAAKDGAEVVRRLQQFSRTHQVGQLRTLILEDVAGDALGLTRGHWQDSARARGVSIDLEQRLAGATKVEGDAAALREAITNLVLNAVDAMPKGGRLTVETRTDGDRAVLVVADTGTGMSEHVRLKAHEPFFTTKGVKATGLGLSVAYGIVRSHGGELTLDSREGRGTTVTLILPRAGATSPAAGSAAAPRAGALRMLLVDDEDEVREALAEMLASHGHTVLTASGADEALERLDAEADLDLVLTDLVMPGRTGWDVAAGVKARRPDMPVGLITGWGDTTDVDDARRAMVDFVVEKPVTVEALQEAVARVRER